MKHAVVFLFLGGCSVGMAMSGKENPNLGAIGQNKTRGEIEMHLGAPIKTVTLDDGTRIDTYEYQIGNEPSAGRAAGHAVMDILTIGLWEIVGTPIEATQGEKYYAVIRYDKEDKAIDIKSHKASSNS